MDEHITTKSLSDGGVNNVVPADGKVAGSDTGEDVVEVKDLMKSVLGKEFPTNEAAIKSLKDTFDYVGQMGQKVKTLEETNKELAGKQVTPELASTVASLQAQLRDSNFFNSNPQYNTPEAKALIGKFGGNPEEVVKDEVFTKAFTAIKTTSEMEQSQSVLHSNPRLGVAQDSMTKAVEAQKAGNQPAAAANAVDAVIGAYGMK